MLLRLILILCLLVSLSYGLDNKNAAVESYTYSKDAGMADLKFTATIDGATSGTGSGSGSSGSGTSGCDSTGQEKGVQFSGGCHDDGNLPTGTGSSGEGTASSSSSTTTSSTTHHHETTTRRSEQRQGQTIYF